MPPCADRGGQGGGADYVLTPEMTNIMEIKRERLFAAIVPEESDATLAAFRELARKLGIFCISARSPSSCRRTRRRTARS